MAPPEVPDDTDQPDPAGSPDDRERSLIEAALDDVWPSAALGSAPAGGDGADWPDRIEGYEIVREIHHGGQGVVYEALQLSTQRRVAIKVLRQGPFADVREVARFEREVMILAQLRHPGIVTVHDSGHRGDCFYYVMDYIAGRPLDADRAARTWPVERTIRLVVQICDAVNTAHLRGVIHRDLKPDNILIDEQGAPRVLDFGLAKVGDEADGGGMSLSGQFIGTLPWASPEQAEGRPEKIDVRTDVYALGVILYRMLTGQFPYEMTGTSQDIRDQIITAPPVPPGSLRRAIDDEVETIVLKCLSKDPERRYQSAGELARDLQRYLDGEAIEAKRDSGWYVLRKLVARRRRAVAVTMAFIVLVAAASITSGVLYRQNARRTQAAGLLAGTAGAFARLSIEADAVADPFSQRTLTSEELAALEQVAAAIELADVDAEVEAELRTTIGLTYHKLRRFDEAEAHLARVVELYERLRPHPDAKVAASLNYLGDALTFNSKLEQAEDAYQRSLRIRMNLFHPPHLDVAESLNDLGSCYRRLGRYTEAESVLSQALAMRRALVDESDPWVAASLNNLAACLKDRGRYADAEAMFREALTRLRALNLPVVFEVRSLRNIAICSVEQGDCDGARAMLAEADRLVETLEGDREREMAVNALVISRCLLEEGALDAAERACRGAMSVLADRYGGRPHVQMADALSQLGTIVYASGRTDEAAQAFTEALRIREAIHGGTHPETAALWSKIAEVKLDRGETDEAERLGRAALEIQQAALAESHPALNATNGLLQRLQP